MPHKTIMRLIGDGDEIAFEIFEKLPSGFVKMRIATPDGRLAFSAEPEFWNEVILALTASMNEGERPA